MEHFDPKVWSHKQCNLMQKWTRLQTTHNNTDTQVDCRIITITRAEGHHLYTEMPQ